MKTYIRKYFSFDTEYKVLKKLSSIRDILYDI